MRLINAKKHHWRLEADDMDAFLRHLETVPATWPAEYCYSQRSEPFLDEWTGSPSFEHAMSLARAGWAEGLSYLSGMVAKAGSITKTVRQNAMGYDVGGAYPMVPLAVAGDPACMVTVGETERATRPYIRFWVNMATSGGVQKDVTARRGAAILAWIDALENAGARCEIWIAEGGKYANENSLVELSVRVKGFDEALSLDRAAYFLLHAGVQRRQFFRFYETLPGFPERSYGVPLDVPPIEDGASTVSFTSMGLAADPAWLDPQSAADKVRAEIVKNCEAVGAMLEAA